MKNSLLTLSFLFLTIPNSYAETCNEKITAIEVKIEQAKKHGNAKQIKGLETALAETKSNCTEGKLSEAHQDKVKGKQEDLTKAQEELNKAKADNKSAKKIQKKQDKVNEKAKELEEVKAAK